MRYVALAMALLFLFPATAITDEPISSLRFRVNMHEIFKNYRGIYISTRDDVRVATTAHVHLMKEHIDNLYAIIPERNADGEPLDKKAFAARLDKLGMALADLGKALTKGDKERIQEFPKTIFSICVGCHTEAKLKYMFRLPRGQKLLSEYMHSVGENYEMAQIYHESGEMERTMDHLFIVNEYLGLINMVFPNTGPSGIIMDRNRLKKQIAEVEGYNELLLTDMKSGKLVNFDAVKKSLNTICIACHEPDKIK
ncbi:MAG: hypothetical protein OEY50_03010 [Nitrospinota bacterium]|nr:hypothetical protein [Nitrospinota bacterium]MDH5679015.1 hypothetical protein [Nitrospinota bacterium]MDH5756766.1 hypothetical protein [Nitrospinota bacterium]